MDDIELLGIEMAKTIADIEMVKQIMNYKSLLDSGFYGVTQCYKKFKSALARKYLEELQHDLEMLLDEDK